LPASFNSQACRSTRRTVACNGFGSRSIMLRALWTLCRHRHKVHKHRNLLAHAPERLHEEISADYNDMIYAATQTVLPSADTAAMLFWALLAPGQINMRKVDGWQTLTTKPIDQSIDLAA
jgi:hypothetical protein